MIYLDKIKIPGFNQKLRANLNLAGEDISGNATGTARAEKGDKAKELFVSSLIRFIDTKDLSALVSLAESRDDRGERKVFNIVNDTASAIGVRQVRFEGDVSIDEQDSIRAWLVSFKLVEYHSVGEKKAQRAKASASKRAKVVAQSKAATAPIVPIKSDPNDPNALAAFDKILKGAEAKLK